MQGWFIRVAVWACAAMLISWAGSARAGDKDNRVKVQELPPPVSTASPTASVAQDNLTVTAQHWASCYGSSCAVIKVSLLDSPPFGGWTNSNPPKGRVEIVEHLSGLPLPQSLRVIFAPMSPGYCGSRDPENQNLWRTWRAAPYTNFEKPVNGGKYIAHLIQYRDKEPYTVTIFKQYSQAFRDAIFKEVSILKAQRARQFACWDNLDYSKLAQQSTDIVVARMTPIESGKPYPTQPNVISRLLDSAGPAGRSAVRPIYTTVNWPFDGPYKKGFIIFLKAKPSTIGWTLPTGWPQISGLTNKEIEEYNRITFTYSRTDSKQWIVPYSPLREERVRQAIRALTPRTVPAWQDRALAFIQAKQSYSALGKQIDKLSEQRWLSPPELRQAEVDYGRIHIRQDMLHRELVKAWEAARNLKDRATAQQNLKAFYQDRQAQKERTTKIAAEQTARRERIEVGIEKAKNERKQIPLRIFELAKSIYTLPEERHELAVASKALRNQLTKEEAARLNAEMTEVNRRGLNELNESAKNIWQPKYEPWWVFDY